MHTQKLYKQTHKKSYVHSRASSLKRVEYEQNLNKLNFTDPSEISKLLNIFQRKRKVGGLRANQSHFVWRM